MPLERPPSPTAGSDEIFEAGAESLGGEAVDEKVEGAASVKVGNRKVKCRALCLDLSPVDECAEVGQVERDVYHFAWVVLQVLGLDKKYFLLSKICLTMGSLVDRRTQLFYIGIFIFCCYLLCKYTYLKRQSRAICYELTRQKWNFVTVSSSIQRRTTLGRV